LLLNQCVTFVAYKGQRTDTEEDIHTSKQIHILTHIQIHRHNITTNWQVCTEIIWYNCGRFVDGLV